MKAESGGLGWAPCWVDQHGRLWGRGNGVCWARAPASSRGRGAHRAVPARCAGSGPRKPQTTRGGRGGDLLKPHLGKSRPLLSAYGGEVELPSRLYITFSQFALCAKVIAEAGQLKGGAPI